PPLRNHWNVTTSGRLDDATIWNSEPSHANGGNVMETVNGSITRTTRSCESSRQPFNVFSTVTLYELLSSAGVSVRLGVNAKGGLPFLDQRYEKSVPVGVALSTTGSTQASVWVKSAVSGPDTVTVRVAVAGHAPGP